MLRFGMSRAEGARLNSIGHVPMELLRAGLELREWTDIDANARHRAKRDLGKLTARKIVKKIRAILRDKAHNEQDIVAMLDKLTVASTEQLVASRAQARSSPPINCPRQVVDGERWQLLVVKKAWKVVMFDVVEDGELACGCASVTRAPEWDRPRRRLPVIVTCNHVEAVSWRCACGFCWWG